ncbi:unnamed protein product [Paramecium sonneborni]|uniref:Uncharacterized protein n=1 Tax=Paramecium sonneborni TaxID=65129 RepID=A0A8S1RKQ3_9CILI|nr:unnamed protein product [Paramecium sonneborni]
MIQDSQIIRLENENQAWESKQQFEEINEGTEYLIGNPYRTNYNVDYFDDGNIMYIKDGGIIKRDKICDQSRNSETYTNLEQIKHLFWDGEYNQKNQRIGKWKAFWKNEILNAGGEFDENGKKVGNWIELFENFQLLKSQMLVIIRMGKKVESGTYFLKINQQVEEIMMKAEKKLDCGLNYILILIGTLKELFYYYSLCQVTYFGEYENGSKQGKWIARFKNQEIGGGQYNEKGIKIGKWIEISNNFQQESQILNVGEYNQGVKSSRWDILFREAQTEEFTKIGGGMYNEEGFQDGEWIELQENYQNDCKIILVGKYSSGKKIERWNALYSDNIIAGGEYNQNGLKTGEWIELNNNFYNYSQTIFKGQYNNGKKQERWDVFCRYDQEKQFEQIGGGNYDQNGIKIGLWIEPIDHIWNLSQIIQRGQYQNNQKKYGKWETLYKEENSQQFQIIAGGNYDEKGLKTGEWAEVDQRFSYSCQVIQRGQYFQGKKVGRWNSHFWEKIIGGGLYDDHGQKNGQWIDLDENFSYIRQLVFVGDYKNGFRIGQFKENNLQ